MNADQLLFITQFAALASAIYYLAAAVAAVACTLLGLLIVDLREAQAERKK